MILGSVSLSGDVSAISQGIRVACSHPDLRFHALGNQLFAGGFFLNDRLPWKVDDFIFESREDDILVLMSGAVYNRAELTGLQAKGAPTTDPSIVAGLFLSEGPGFVSRLNGDFVILIIRTEGKEAFLFRDHVGIRPLAYTYDGRVLSFSTDIIGLSRAFCREKRIKEDFFLKNFKYADYRVMPCDHVKKFPPGHYLKICKDGINITRYWNPEEIKTDYKLSYDRMLSDLDYLLHDSVRIRCDNRFTAGAHVSGGLDSCVVAALARREYFSQERFHGFSWSPLDFEPPGEEFADERELVNKSCGKANIISVFSESGLDGFMKAWASFFEYGHFYAEHLISDRAVESGTNLVFSGWGGDEFISTGVTAIESDLLRELRFRLFLKRQRIDEPKLFVKRVLYSIVLPALGILDRSAAMGFRNDACYLKKEYRRSDRQMIREFHFNMSRREFHLMMLRFYHLQLRCEHWTVAGYRKGLEYRYPLLDRRIVEYMIRIPSVLLCNTDEPRPILRVLGQSLVPDEVLRNYSKRDQVYFAHMHKSFREAGRIYIDQADSWRENPDLQFVDFELLEKDIAAYRKGSEAVDEMRLFRMLVYLKGMHEFTLKYHSSGW